MLFHIAGRIMYFFMERQANVFDLHVYMNKQYFINNEIIMSNTS